MKNATYQTITTDDGRTTYYLDWGQFEGILQSFITPKIQPKFRFFGLQAISGRELNDLFLALFK